MQFASLSVLCYGCWYSSVSSQVGLRLAQMAADVDVVYICILAVAGASICRLAVLR